MKPISNPTFSSPNVLNEFDSKNLLKRYNIPVVEEQLTSSMEEALEASAALGFPVTAKGVGSAWQHKTESGLVHLNLPDASAVRSAVRSIRTTAGKKLEAILIQRHLAGQRELMGGLFRDPLFGPVVLFGLGGTLAEALDDVVMALAPLDRTAAEDMISLLKAQKLLKVFRGEEKVNAEALVKVLMGLSRLALDHPDISEIDINPLKVTPQGEIYAVDALVLRQNQDPLPVTPHHVAAETIGRLFYPRSIAFVGASSQIGKWGNMLPVNTISGGYKGKIYLVNPKGGEILGRTVHKTVEEIDDKVDLAVVTVPAKSVAGLIPQFQSKRIRYLVLVSSGFGETGAAGQKLEQDLVAQARTAGILILGPNTMGIANPHISLFCTGSAVSPMAGGTAMVSQSGNMGTQLLAFAEKQGIGVRGFSGSGNEAMITVEDFLEGFESDELTRAVILYVESIKDGERFFRSARRVSRKKPIVLLKGGQTPAGMKAAATHTGALMTDNRVFNAMCRQSGIIKVEKPMELLDLAAAFSAMPLPSGPRVAIMTLGGGWGVVTADLCLQHGLSVPELDDRMVALLDPLLPSYWSRTNPVDLVGEQNPELPVKALEALAGWEGCDAVIHLGILGRRIFLERMCNAALECDPGMDEDHLNRIREMLNQFERNYIEHAVNLMETYRKPIVGVHLMTDGHDQTLYRVKNAVHKGLFYETPERAVYALSKMVAYRKTLDDRNA